MGVIVVGSANLDLIYRVARIPEPGETLLAKSAEQHPGGKGNNQAIAVARAGADVGFIAAIGNDPAGDVLVGALASAGVGDLIRRVDSPTGTALITVDDAGENTIIVNSGANAELVELTAVERRAIGVADYLLVQLETPLPTVMAAVEIAAAASTRVVFNASPIRSLPAELLGAVDVLLVNEHEALILAAEFAPNLESGLARDLVPDRTLPDGLTVDTAIGVAELLVTKVRAVVITLGGDGAVVFGREMADIGVVHVPAARVTPVDTTGAGDAFAGAFVAALSRGDSLVDATEFASAAGAIAVQRHGAVPSIPGRREIDEFRAAR